MAKIKEGFKGERLVSLPENLLNDYGRDPLIGDLYVRKIGFFPPNFVHFSMDVILSFFFTVA